MNPKCRRPKIEAKLFGISNASIEIIRVEHATFHTLRYSISLSASSRAIAIANKLWNGIKWCQTVGASLRPFISHTHTLIHMRYSTISFAFSTKSVWTPPQRGGTGPLHINKSFRVELDGDKHYAGLSSLYVIMKTNRMHYSRKKTAAVQIPRGIYSFSPPILTVLSARRRVFITWMPSGSPSTAFYPSMCPNEWMALLGVIPKHTRWRHERQRNLGTHTW